MNRIKQIVLFLLCVAVSSTAGAASLVQGIIYLKDGSVVECSEKDRLKLPKRSGDVKLFRKAFYKDKVKEIFKYEDIDSIVCWHPVSPAHQRKFIPAPEAGWLWAYIETPYIGAYVYSQKGYGIDNNGGIQVLVKQRYFSRSKTVYYLRKEGDAEFHDVGSASRNAKKGFRERIAEYISDNKELAEQILESESSNRSKIILMLNDYYPKTDKTQ